MCFFFAGAFSSGVFINARVYINWIKEDIRHGHTIHINNVEQTTSLNSATAHPRYFYIRLNLVREKATRVNACIFILLSLCVCVFAIFEMVLKYSSSLPHTRIKTLTPNTDISICSKSVYSSFVLFMREREREKKSCQTLK